MINNKRKGKIMKQVKFYKNGMEYDLSTAQFLGDTGQEIFYYGRTFDKEGIYKRKISFYKTPGGRYFCIEERFKKNNFLFYIFGFKFQDKPEIIFEECTLKIVISYLKGAVIGVDIPKA